MAPQKTHNDLPRDYAATYQIETIIADMEEQLNGCTMDPAVTAMKELLESNRSLNNLCLSMFAEAKELVRAKRAHPAYLAIDNIPILMRLLDYILTRSPQWEDIDFFDHLGGLPLNLVLMVLMETHSGLQLFKQANVNQHLKRILGRWALFLESPKSVYALNPRDGWLSYSAIAKLEDVANSPTRARRKFTDIYDCPDPKNPETLGFASWDAFFSRKLKPGVRPTPAPELLLGLECQGSAILNACESRPWQMARHSLRCGEIILKGELYSVYSMLGYDPLSEHFVKGTVYQAYLSALSYHRWHSPVSGVIRKILHIDGSYFSQLPMSDILSMEKSQSYLATVATRAVVFIDATDLRVGLICFVGVGMGEVSSCKVSVKEGDYVEAGDEIGSFHYGGSTHCLLFREGLNVQFERCVEDKQRVHNIPVRSLLARCFP
ncbi:putative phosphatidylserine decarboxylase [Aspergillus cavernicola]|uniref:Phosphatidylserine decarboxylase n=1 Tax=Aspergillus cavernicola TaxID=176166 RepID=A0ABR4HU63_9EURO